MKTGIDLIKKEREKQLSKYSIEDDSICNCTCELSRVAERLLCYNYKSDSKYVLDISSERKSIIERYPNKKCEALISPSYKERLIIAGALIAAEIDRIIEIDKEK